MGAGLRELETRRDHNAAGARFLEFIRKRHLEASTGMADIVSWVTDRLHEIVGLSDRQVAEYIIELARRSKSFEELTKKLQSTGAIKISPSVETFVGELWKKFPHDEDPVERKVTEKSKKVVYKLLLDDEPTKGNSQKKRPSRNIRTLKATSWESDDEDTSAIASDGGSDSDEWERFISYSYFHT